MPRFTGYARKGYKAKAKGGAGKAATKATVASLVRKSVFAQAERKYVTGHISHNIYNDVGGSMTLLSVVNQGGAADQRIGDNITYTSLKVKGSFTLDPYSGTGSAAALGTTTVRLCLVQTTKNTLIAPQSADLFEDITYEWASPWALDPAIRSGFKVLHDETISLTGGRLQLTGGVVTGAMPALHNFEFDILRFPIPKVKFMVGNSAVGQGGLYLFAVTDNTSGAAPIVTMRANFVLRFVDL